MKYIVSTDIFVVNLRSYQQVNKLYLKYNKIN